MSQYVYGKNVVRQLIREQKKIYEIVRSSGLHDKELERLISQCGIPCKEISRKEMDAMFRGVVHQGIAAHIEDYKTYSIEEILACVPQGKTPLLVMLDGLEDPHNLAYGRCCGCRWHLAGKKSQCALDSYGRKGFYRCDRYGKSRHCP